MRHSYLCLLYSTHFRKGFAVNEKILGAGGIFLVWIRQCFEHIYKAVILRMVPVAGHTHSFPICSSRMTSAPVINFPIFLTLGPTAAHSGHQFLTLKCPSANSMAKREATRPQCHCTHTVEMLGRNAHTSEKLCSSHPSS